RSRFIGPECNRRGALQQGRQRLAGGAFGRDPHQPVLDDVVRHVALAQRAPDLGQLADFEAAVFADDERPRARDLVAELRDFLPLGLGWHEHLLPPRSATSGAQPARGGGAGPTPLRRTCPATDSVLQGRSPTGRWKITGPASACSPASPGCPAASPGPVRRIKPRPSGLSARRPAGAGYLRRSASSIVGRAAGVAGSPYLVCRRF